MLGGLALVFTGVHVGAIVVDTYVHFGLVDVLVPFAAKWHPVAVAAGIGALYLLAAVELTSLLRARLPRVVWRRVHYASFPLFVFATVHGLTAGTDTTRRVALFVAAASGLAVGRDARRPDAAASLPRARAQPGPGRDRSGARTRLEVTVGLPSQDPFFRHVAVSASPGAACGERASSRPTRTSAVRRAVRSPGCPTPRGGRR